MAFKDATGKLFYGIAFLASLAGALMLLTGFLIAADWHVGVIPLMAIYLFLSLTGTVGLFIAVLTFWSNQRRFAKVALVSNIETLAFASFLATMFLFDRERDYTPMIIGISRSLSIAISTVSWFVFPVATSLIGTCAAIAKVRDINQH